MGEADNVVREKSFAFAIRMMNLYRYLVNVKKEFVLSKQLLCYGTAIGAMVREAEQAESKADFIHKLAIAPIEANETEYWLLLYETGYLTDAEKESITADNTELLKLLTSIINTTKKKNVVNHSHNERQLNDLLPALSHCQLSTINCQFTKHLCAETE